MVPRLLFAALVFGSLASRPDVSSGRRHPAPEATPAREAPTIAPLRCPPVR